MFSYGSGMASSMFIFKVEKEYSKMKKQLNVYDRMASRVKISTTEFDAIMQNREKVFGFLPTSPTVRSISFYN